MRRYRLEIDEEQARTLSRACELLSRVHNGQLDEVANVLLTAGGLANGAPHAVADIVGLREGLRALEPLVTGMPTNANPGIRSPDISDEARTAYDLYQVLRHRLAWDARPEGGCAVSFDKPSQTDTTWRRESGRGVSNRMATIEEISADGDVTDADDPSNLNA